MNAKATRILKEARPLFWPWCAVVIAGVLPLVHPLHSMRWISLIGFYLGIPLLATLPLGNEFQHRTLSLLLSQPVRRMEIWGEKLSVTVVAVLSAVLVFAIAWRGSAPGPGSKILLLGGAFIIDLIASATFWTLLARSTMGGVVLTIAAQYVFIIAVKFVDDLCKNEYLSGTNTNSDTTVTLVFLGYAGVMLWFGGRAFARFQVTGGMAGDDLLMAGSDVMPGAWAGWLRCRPTEPVLNLIRKELRLLWPIWLISFLAAVGWACLVLFGLLHGRGFSTNFETAAVSVGVVSTLVIAILAGSLSLGEERTLGTHAWHLTLPVPARHEWLIKLFMALFAGFVGAGLVPLLIAGRLLGSSHMLADVHVGIDLLVGAVLLSFAAFWCACAVNGTVRAVLWVLPVMIALYFAGELGRWVGPVLTDLFFSRFDPFANLKFAHAVSSMFETFAISRFAFWEFFYNRGYYAPMVCAVLVPTLFLAVIQSYRLFRAQLQDSALSLVRNLLPSAVVALLCSISFMAFFSFVVRARNQESIAVFETIQAIQKIQSGAAKLDAAHPLQLTVEDLAKASSLSKSTRRFLGNSHITLTLEEAPHQGRYGCGENPQPNYSPHKLGYSWCLATIPLADGSHFTVAFEPGNHYLMSAGIDK